MFPTVNDLDWIDLQLQSAAYYSHPYNRITYRLRSLLNELEPMKIRITEPTFWLGQERKVGDILDGPTGPVKYERGLNGHMQPVPQFVELAEELPPVQPIQQPTPLPTPSPINEAPPVSVTGKHTIKELFEQAKATKAQIESETADALSSYNDAAGVVRSAIKSLKDDAVALQAEVSEYTNGAPT